MRPALQVALAMLSVVAISALVLGMVTSLAVGTLASREAWGMVFGLIIASLGLGLFTVLEYIWPTEEKVA